MEQSEIFRHEDERRVLIEWIRNSNFVSSKIVIAKSEIPIGDHYHSKKDEVFLLISGKAKRVVMDNHTQTNIEAPYKWNVPRNTYHLFELEKGSILIGVADQPFDPEDELKPGTDRL